MGTVVKLVLYLVALLLFAGGAFVVGLHVGVAQDAAARKAAAAPAGAEAPKRDIVALVKTWVSDAPGSPAWHLGAGLGAALLGLIIARPPVTLGPRARKPAREERRRPLREVMKELTDDNPEVRYQAARTLTTAAKVRTIPALIKALQDPEQKVRGQAGEALTNMTGRTFDFMDVAPESMRQESVRQWIAWWRAGKEQILAGADPKTVGAAAAPDGAGAADEEPALPSPDEAFADGAGPGLGAPETDLPPPPEDVPGGEAGTGAGDEAGGIGLGPELSSPDEPSPAVPPGADISAEPGPTSALGSAAVPGKAKVAPRSTTRRKRKSTAMIKRAALGLASMTEPEEKQSGRNLSIGELVRRKRERAAAAREAADAPSEGDAAAGAAPAGGGAVDLPGKLPADVRPEEPPESDSSDSSDEGAPSEGGIPLADTGPAELPRPDEDLPPPV